MDDRHERGSGEAAGDTAGLYASPPAVVPRLEECLFYQAIDIPGHGVQPGIWDLRPGIEQYLGDADFSGRRVLEVGTANGFVCFEMERRGADVVAFDLADNLIYDAPPLSVNHLVAETYRTDLRRIRNAWWLAHSALGSRARVAYGHANSIPPGLGRFDVGVLANVLPHLQNPIGALMGLAAISDEAVVVTEADWLRGIGDELPGMIYFDTDDPWAWFQVKPRLVEAVLRRMGFGDLRRTEHRQLRTMTVEHTAQGPVGAPTHAEIPHYTVVGRRK
jgi:SAM-dependent methyltransferase